MKANQFKQILTKVEYELNQLTYQFIEMEDIKPYEISFITYWDVIESVYYKECGLTLNDDLFFKFLEFYFSEDSTTLEYLREQWV